MSKKKSKKKDKESSAKNITWESIKVRAKDIDPTPGNFKLKTELGDERLNNSLEMFGMAGTILLNPGKKKGRFDLINGNSRWEKQMEKDPNAFMNASVPNRPLTAKEYKEMAAMVDFAVAGDVDEERIRQELGTTQDFFARWGMELPETLRQKAEDMEEEQAKNAKGLKGKSGNGKPLPAPEKEVQMVITLVYNEKKEKQFRAMAEKLEKKFKSDDISEIVFLSLKKLTS